LASWYHCLIQFPHSLCSHKNKRRANAIARSSFPRRPIAVLNAMIIPSYIISWSWNVPVKIAPSLTRKEHVGAREPTGDGLLLRQRCHNCHQLSRSRRAASQGPETSVCAFLFVPPHGFVVLYGCSIAIQGPQYHICIRREGP